MNMELINDVKVVLVKAGQTSAGTKVESDVVDVSGYDGVTFVGSIATHNAGNFMEVEQSDASDLSNPEILAGSRTPAGTNGYSPLIDVYRPLKRYLRATITRAGANTATGDIYAILYHARKKPVSHGATIVAVPLVSPAEAA